MSCCNHFSSPYSSAYPASPPLSTLFTFPLPPVLFEPLLLEPHLTVVVWSTPPPVQTAFPPGLLVLGVDNAGNGCCRRPVCRRHRRALRPRRPFCSFAGWMRLEEEELESSSSLRSHHYTPNPWEEERRQQRLGGRGLVHALLPVEEVVVAAVA